MGRPVWKPSEIGKHGGRVHRRMVVSAYLLLERVHSFRVFLCELLDGLRVSRVGPDDDVMERLAGLLVPDDGGFSSDRKAVHQLTAHGSHRETRAPTRTVDS